MNKACSVIIKGWFQQWNWTGFPLRDYVRFHLFQQVSIYHVIWESRYFLQDKVKLLTFDLSCVSTGNVRNDFGPMQRKLFLYVLFIFLGRLGSSLCLVWYLCCLVRLLFLLSKWHRASVLLGSCLFFSLYPNLQFSSIIWELIDSMPLLFLWAMSFRQSVWILCNLFS